MLVGTRKDVKSIPSLRSTSHGTFEHVAESLYSHTARRATFVTTSQHVLQEGFGGRALVLSMQARWWPHPVEVGSHARNAQPHEVENFLALMGITTSTSSSRESRFGDVWLASYPRAPP
ncbi:uncharacterized protein LOC143900780 isoform X1 [Temnothorax americanus]|uniref:uncharacterized protein LOC143900780 isoform X1 n=1 Tax=Temnothorax americanus TaxID=1964332 RepID=UPI00406971B1